MTEPGPAKTPPSFGARLWARLHQPHDAAALVVFRIAFGLVVLTSALRFLAFGWIDQLYVAPRFHFRYWGFDWLPIPSGPVVQVLFVALALLGAMVALGLFFRPAVGLLFLIFTYLQLVDVATYLNHYYLVSLLAGLAFFMPLNRWWAVDARLRPRLRSPVVPAWCTYLLRIQVGIVYVNAGLAKATADWLLHAQPLSIWLSSRTDLPIIGPYLHLSVVAFIAAWAGFLFDTTIVFWLSWRRTRALAYCAVIAFHLMTRLLFPAIGMFPFIMMVSALVYFDPAWPRRLAARLRVPLPLPLPGRVTGAPRWRPMSAFGAFSASAFLLAQALIPLRAHLYDGNVLWHEQGMRFSWRVMAREKNGSVTFIVRHPGTGREWHVSPAKYLTRVQEREMAVQPDLILQLARRISRDFAAAGHPRVTVHADARASLNGRPAEVLVDPAIDLARQTDGLLTKSWIRPAPTGAPPRLHPLASRTL